MRARRITTMRTAGAFAYCMLSFSVLCFGEKGGITPIQIQSPAFKNNQTIPAQHTCDGQDLSPSLTWKNIPGKTQSIVLICDDPDAPAGTWVHWVCYDLPAETKSLPEGIPKSDSLPGGGKQGVTDFGTVGYGGPCPPSGTHRYFFKVYALDGELGLPAGKSKRDVEQAMKGHILAQGQLVGTYSKK
jgi:Raf kinase inhibitor-like YbhB/YbcL family protein